MTLIYLCSDCGLNTRSDTAICDSCWFGCASPLAETDDPIDDPERSPRFREARPDELDWVQ